MVAFDAGINQMAAKTLGDHAERLLVPREGFEYFVPPAQVRKLAREVERTLEHRQYPSFSVLSGMGADFNLSSFAQRLAGTSALISAHMALANCYSRGLRPVLHEAEEAEEQGGPSRPR